MSYVLDDYYCPKCDFTEEHLHTREERPDFKGPCPNGCRDVFYTCLECNMTHPSTADRFDPDGGECECGEPINGLHLQELPILLKRGIGNAKFCLIADGGGTSTRAIQRGKLSDDQAMRNKERLRKRSLDYCKSPEGIAVRMAQKERLEKRMGVPLSDKPFRVDKW